MKIELIIALVLCTPICLLSQIGQSKIGDPELAESRRFRDMVAQAAVPATSDFVSNCCFLRNTTPLPVELSYFQANLNEALDVDLDWETATEINNDYFEVEHSIDGTSFHVIEKVSGQGTVSTPTTYNHIHTEPVAGTNYYRLRQVDFDEGFSYSNIETVFIAPSDRKFYQVYPNPTTGVITVVSDGAAVISVVDMNGRILLEQQMNDRQIIDVSRFSNGLYILKMEQKGILKKLVFVKQ